MIRTHPAQFDMFAAFAPPRPIVKAAPLPPLVRTGDKHKDDDAARDQMRDAETAAEAAGAVETIAWGSGTKPGHGYWFSMPWGKPGIIIKLWQVEPGRWVTALATQRINGGGLSGFWHGDKGHPTREAALLAVMRTQLNHCAYAQSMKDWGDGEYPKEAAAADKLAAWVISMCPPLVYGVDLAAEYAELVAAKIEKEQRRRAMQQDVHQLQKQAAVAIYEPNGIYTGPNFSGDTPIMDTSDDDIEWQDRFAGEYCVTGHSPGGLEIVVYPKCHTPRSHLEEGTPPEILERALERLAAGVSVPVRHAREDELSLCHSDRRKVTW